MLRGYFRLNEGEVIGALLLFRKAADAYSPEATTQLANVYEMIARQETLLNHPITTGQQIPPGHVWFLDAGQVGICWFAQGAATIEVVQNPWADNFKKVNNRVPVVKIGRIIATTDGDIINTEILANDLVRALQTSGKAEVVASTAEADQAREERKQQDVHASAETRKESFQETAPDYLIIGTIGVQNDQANGLIHKFYATTLKMTDVKTQKQILFDKKISKTVER